MAKQTIPDRVCPHCGGTEWDVRIVNKDGYTYTVHMCYTKVLATRARHKDYRETLRKTEIYRNKHRQRNKESYHENKDRWIQASKRYNAKPEVKEQKRLQGNVRTDLLPDCVIRARLVTIIGRQYNPIITPEMITRYRQHLKLERVCKQLKSRSKTIQNNLTLECLKTTVSSIITRS